MNQIALAKSPTLKSDELARGLGLFDSTMFVVGAMIGSGTFIVPAEMTRNVGSADWLLGAWAVAGVLTAANQPRFMAIIRNVNNSGERYTRLQLYLTHGIKRANEEHHQILELCRKHVAVARELYADRSDTLANP